MTQRSRNYLVVLLPPVAMLATNLAAGQDIEKRTLRFTAASNKGHPQVQGVEKFAELVAKKSGGNIEATAFQRKVARDEAAKVLGELKKVGMTVNELPPAEVANLKADAQPVIAKHSKTVGEDFVAEVNAELAKIRAKK